MDSKEIATKKVQEQCPDSEAQQPDQDERHEEHRQDQESCEADPVTNSCALQLERFHSV
jgi:hypothetical protein